MQMTNYCNHLFTDSTDGYIQILKINNKDNTGQRIIKIYNTRNGELREVVEEFHEDNDVFLSPNTMYLPKIRVENIRQFRALYQDMDFEHLGLHKSEIVYLVWTLHYEGKIPKPTMVVDSGRGVHFYWRIKNAPYGAF